MKPLFEKPLGAIFEIGPTVDNCDTGTTRAVTCQICGTKHNELAEFADDDYHTAIVLGRQVVLECCGRIFNILYDDLGEVFAVAKLDELAENPTNNLMLLSHIKECMIKASKQLAETSSNVAQIIHESKKIVP